MLLCDNGWVKIPRIVPPHLTDEVRGDNAAGEPVTTSHEHRNIWEAWDQEDASLTPEFRFGMVRNPYARWGAKIRQTIVGKNIPRVAPDPIQILAIFAAMVPGKNLQNESGQPLGGTGMEDNHWRPQADFIGSGAHIWKLEEPHCNRLIDELTSRDILAPGTEMPKLNSHPMQVITPWCNAGYGEAHAFFKKYYEHDFRIFHYGLLDSLAETLD
jgi:hypothetical protein